MTYARSRLWLGITSVGTLVVIAMVMLVSGYAQAAFGHDDASFATGLKSWCMILGIYAMISAPFDFLGGFWLPRIYHRKHPPFPRFALGWARGVFVQCVLMLGGALLLLCTARLFGMTGAVVVALMLMLSLVGFQSQAARLVADLRKRPGWVEVDAKHAHLPPIQILQAQDEGFTGGISGLPGFERLVLPDQWLELLSHEQLSLQLLRKEGALRTGSRTRGVAMALAWNLVGFILCAVAPASDMMPVAGLLTISLWLTLWSFFGLLILPTPSRSGVLEADR